MDRKILTAFMASPGDVTAERQAVVSIVRGINRRMARDWNWELEVYGWEDTLRGYGRPQSLINADLDSADVFVGILSKRWGTPPGSEYTSGFEEEYERALARRAKGDAPAILLFFRTPDDEARRDPGRQLAQVLAFRARVEGDRQVFFYDYDSLDDFQEKLDTQLSRLLNARIQASQIPVEPTVEPSGTTEQDRLRGDEPPTEPESKSATEDASSQAHWDEKDAPRNGAGAWTAVSPGGEIPAYRFLELVSDPGMTPERLVDRWAQSATQKKLDLLPSAIGSNRFWTLNVLNPRGGGTIMIGTTGTGKTEATITMATATAISLGPELSHVVVTSIENRPAVHPGAELLFERMDLSYSGSGLAMLQKEMTRRERLLAVTGHADAAQFWEIRPERRKEMPVWIVIIGDLWPLRFAGHDHYENVMAMIERGNELYMHFIAESQVTTTLDDIARSVFGRRVVLRTSTEFESIDVLGTAAAGRFSRAAIGMAIVREGPGVDRIVRFARASGVGDNLRDLYRRAMELRSRPS